MTTINNTDEIFRVVVGYENYKVSNFGNVYNINKSKFLKQSTHKEGYLYVSLYNNKKYSLFLVHRLVALAFLENPDNKRFVDHINNDRKNNHINNLRYATCSENSMNRVLSINNSSGVKGVVFYKATQKWSARITIDGITKHLGFFDKIEEAQQVRLKTVNNLFKEFTNACEQI
jgi:hypothetical protein